MGGGRYGRGWRRQGGVKSAVLLGSGSLGGWLGPKSSWPAEVLVLKPLQPGTDCKICSPQEYGEIQLQRRSDSGFEKISA